MSQYKSQTQNMFLSQARKKHQKVELVLETGTVLRGKLKAYDQFSVTLGFKDQSEVIYKSSIIYITLVPPMRTPGFDRKPRYNSNYRDDDYSRNYNDYEDDDSDDLDYEENTKALNSYRKLGDTTEDYNREDSYRRNDSEGYRREGGYRRENDYRREDGDNAYRRDSNYRRSDSEGYRRDGGYRRGNNYRREDGDNGYRRDSNYRRNDSEGYRREGGYRKDTNYRRDDGENGDRRDNGYQKPYYRKRNDDYNRPFTQRRPYNRRDDDDDDPPPPKKVIVKRY